MSAHLLTPADVCAALCYVPPEGRLHVFTDDLDSAVGVTWEYYRLNLHFAVNQVTGVATFGRNAQHISRATPAAGAEAARRAKGALWELGEVGIYGIATPGSSLGRLELIEYDLGTRAWWLNWTSKAQLPPDALHRWLLDHLIPK